MSDSGRAQRCRNRMGRSLEERLHEDKDNVEAAILYAQARGVTVKIEQTSNTGKSADATVDGKKEDLRGAICGRVRRKNYLQSITVINAEGTVTTYER